MLDRDREAKASMDQAHCQYNKWSPDLGQGLRGIAYDHSVLAPAGLGMVGKRQSQVSNVENRELRLEQNVAIDLKAAALIPLQTAGASFSIDSAEIEKVAMNRGHVLWPQGNLEVGKLRFAWKREHSLQLVERGTRHLLVVGLGHFVVDEHECCARVRNGLATSLVLLDLPVSNLVPAGFELPKSIRRVYLGCGEVAFESSSVDLAELVEAVRFVP